VPGAGGAQSAADTGFVATVARVVGLIFQVDRRQRRQTLGNLRPEFPGLTKQALPYRFRHHFLILAWLRKPCCACCVNTDVATRRSQIHETRHKACGLPNSTKVSAIPSCNRLALNYAACLRGQAFRLAENGEFQ
jgi:hypothetical protein